VTTTLDILIQPDDTRPLDRAAESLPARPGVVAFENAAGDALLLAATGDLRRFALTRLGRPDEQTPASRENLAPITARLRARVVGSAFEGDALYLEEARTRLPQTYRSVLDTRRAWCVHLDPEADPPVWRRLDLLGASVEPAHPGTLIGPFRDKHAATRFAERLDDLFDLCRTPRELEIAPRGRACAYKEMGRCDAPCDGSAGMEAYRARVRDAVRFAAQPVALSLSAIEQRMSRAAATQDFELAQSLKSRMERIARGVKPTTTWRSTLDRFMVLGAFPSTRRGRARLFLATASAIEPWADVAGDISPEDAHELMQPILAGASRLRPTRPLAPHECERLGLLARHLYNPGRGAGGLLALDPPPEGAALCTLIRRAAKVRDDSPDEEVVETQLGLND
jgi:hypothetical protein